ncbi:hypothetical protein [Corynebacterium sp.]|uniref:hypothetical protein n=1 Tax=Corynebacterium sp. TaxID=1720 RepID=UPI003735FF4A
MNQHDSWPGRQGGFARPTFTPGPGVGGAPDMTSPPGSGVARGVKADLAEREDQLRQERRDANQRRRKRIYVAIALAVVAIVVIVAVMVWLWSGDVFLPAAN